MSYTVRDYADMLDDHVRMDAYQRALAQAVRPGCTVLDLGTGAGYFALAACKLGARHVYGIETNDAIQVARELVKANGLGDRVTLFAKKSQDVTLPERVDVLVSDLRGVLPLLGHHIPSIVDARTRFLAPGGAQIPRRDHIWAVPVEAGDAHQKFLAPIEPHALDLLPLQQVLLNGFTKHRVPRASFLAEAQRWTTLDYHTITDPNITGTCTFIVTRPGTGHGLQVWFDAELAEGIGFSTAPMGPEAIYGTAYFPWAEAVTLQTGDEITLRLDAHLVADEYVWRWRTRVTPIDRRRAHTSFDQSTFFGAPIPSERLARRASTHRPRLNEHGTIDLFILARLAEGVVLDEIAAAVADGWPARYPTRADALAHVGSLSDRYGGD